MDINMRFATWDLNSESVNMIQFVTNTGKKVGHTNFEEGDFDYISLSELSSIDKFPNREIIAIGGCLQMMTYFFYYSEEKVRQ